MASQELEQLVAGMRLQAQNPPAAAVTMEQQRAGFETMMAAYPLGADVTAAPADAGGVKGEWVSAAGSDASRVILYLHGGGYILGSSVSHREMVSRIARAAGCRALVLDYRLAPEHPFPAAVEDAVTAYRWLLAQGIEPGKIVVAGDSAGGGLTAATLVAIRDQGLPAPAAGAMLSPWTDLAGTGDSMTSRAERDPMIRSEALIGMASAYLGSQDAKDPLASPLYADLKGLPELYVTVGAAEVLYDDASRFVEKARRAGVAATFDPWDDMVHVWQLFAQLPEASASTDKIGAFIKARTS